MIRTRDENIFETIKCLYNIREEVTKVFYDSNDSNLLAILCAAIRDDNYEGCGAEKL
jgi:hypothetical protein